VCLICEQTPVHGELHETLINIHCERDITEPDFLEEALSNSGHWWTNRSIASSSSTLQYYADAVDGRLNHLLEYYVAEFARQKTDGTFMMPVGAIALIRNLLALSNQRLLMVCADKAVVDLSEMSVVDVPDVYLHGSACFSFTANFHALSKVSSTHNNHRCTCV
jgi:hypothetical protein